MMDDELIPQGAVTMEDGTLAAEEEMLLPPYLREVDTAPVRSCGTLSYNRRSKCWVVKGDPDMTEMCKRLFPGSQGSKRGEARFADTRRVMSDLCWLMQRYPLTVKLSDLTRFDESVGKARKAQLRKVMAQRLPQHAVPPEGSFEGTLRPFQQEGLAFLLRNERCLLADEMGLGKTVQALSLLASTGDFPALIVPPAHLVLNWQRQALRFLRINGKPPRIHIIKGLTPMELPEADIYILHYLLLRGWKQTLPQLGFKCVIFDEVQELRHTGTEKYSAASLLSDSCERVIGLSGTPIYNKGGEIWNVINVLDFHFLGDWESFSREWCGGYGTQVVLKPDVLGAYLKREGMMLRRTKEQVLTELPPKRRLVQQLDWNDSVYAALMKPILPQVLQWKTDKSLTEGDRALLQESISRRARQASGTAKAPYVCQFVRALLENGERVLLFAHHHEVMDIYKKELKAFSPGFITGRETQSEKERSVARFMEGKTDVLCISLRSASGLNLQSATCVVFGELDWSPAVHSQAQDRAHRMGHTDSLLCYYLVAPAGSDADMQEALGLKVSQFTGLMGDAPASPDAVQEGARLARRHVEHIVQQMKL